MLGGSSDPLREEQCFFALQGQAKCSLRGSGKRIGGCAHPSSPIPNRLQVGNRRQLTLPEPSSAPVLWIDVLDKKDDLPPKLGLRNLLYPTVRFSKPGRESLSLLLTSMANRFPWTHVLEEEAGFMHMLVHV